MATLKDSKDTTKLKDSAEDTKLIARFNRDVVRNTVIVKRARPAASRRKVNVYVDGLLWTIDEDMLQRMLDIGFWIRVN